MLASLSNIISPSPRSPLHISAEKKRTIEQQFRRKKPSAPNPRGRQPLFYPTTLHHLLPRQCTCIPESSAALVTVLLVGWGLHFVVVRAHGLAVIGRLGLRRSVFGMSCMLTDSTKVGTSAQQVHRQRLGFVDRPSVLRFDRGW